MVVFVNSIQILREYCVDMWRPIWNWTFCLWAGIYSIFLSFYSNFNGTLCKQKVESLIRRKYVRLFCQKRNKYMINRLRYGNLHIIRCILYYIPVSALNVNINPRPSHISSRAFGSRLWYQLSGLRPSY